MATKKFYWLWWKHNDLYKSLWDINCDKILCGLIKIFSEPLSFYTFYTPRTFPAHSNKALLPHLYTHLHRQGPFDCPSYQRNIAPRWDAAVSVAPCTPSHNGSDILCRLVTCFDLMLADVVVCDSSDSLCPDLKVLDMTLLLESVIITIVMQQIDLTHKSWTENNS